MVHIFVYQTNIAPVIKDGTVSIGIGNYGFGVVASVALVSWGHRRISRLKPFEITLVTKKKERKKIIRKEIKKETKKEIKKRKRAFWTGRKEKLINREKRSDSEMGEDWLIESQSERERNWKVDAYARKRERERERQTDRQTNRETERERERERHTQRERERERQRERQRQRERERERERIQCSALIWYHRYI